MLQKTLVTAQTRKNSQDAEALNEMELFCTFEKLVNIFCVKLKYFYHLIIAFLYLALKDNLWVWKVLLGIGVCATHAIVRDQNNLPVQIPNIEIIEVVFTF